MSWICPVCKKEYSKVNQSHDCNTLSVEVLFKYNEDLIGLYEYLLETLQPFGKIIIRTSRKAITLANRSGFAIVYPKKDSIELRFYLNRLHEDHPVYRVQQYSKNRFMHWTRLYDKEDLDAFILDLLKEAYDLAS